LLASISQWTRRFLDREGMVVRESKAESTAQAVAKATPAQIALAWVMAQKPWIVPIPGTRSLEHLSENLGAVDVELTTDDLRAIRTALSAITVQGGRMNKEQMAQVDRTN
jgi:aryl-alcohol dehydrogenase-like predicted oxidoreductase